MTLIAGKVGCTTETLRRWCREEASRRAGPAAQAANDRERLKLLEREVNYYAANEGPHDPRETASGKSGTLHHS